MSTKQRILDAAERLFAERGYDGTSLRAITTEAGANLASVNYHFRSKEALLEALFSRRLGTLNRQRLEILDRLEAEAGGRPVRVENLVRALIELPLRLSAADDAAAFGQLLGRMYSAPGGFPQKLMAEELRGFAKRFRAAFRRTLPGISEEELTWRIFFLIGAMAHTMAAPELLRAISGGLCDPSDVETTIQRLLTFVLAGLKAPSGPSRDGTEKARRSKPLKQGGYAE